MGMNSPQRKISRDSSSEEVMDMRKMVAVEEKYITRSYFKEDKILDHNGPPKRSSSKTSLNKLGRTLAEVFRTDFITAMKIPESQQLPPGKYITLKDTWRQEWEKGVQVPVYPESTQKIAVYRKVNFDLPKTEAFILPENKITFDQEKYNQLIDRNANSCNYDLDGQDTEWLKKVSSLRTLKRAATIDELTMERAITWFERECFEKMTQAVATKECLSIEYDESTTCNVCLSPDAEDGNEIVFCDACMMCAHQHCYGVLEIPEGAWLCNPCSRGILSPPCCLCPNKGGAMKRIKDSLEWVHVICAWWIPEVQIEDVKYIERITKDKIPASRWNLTCSVCYDKMGACIQCTMKRCVRAYHVTCAVQEGLEMRTVVIPEKNDVQHLSFCSKHCEPVPPDKNSHLVKSKEIENNRIKELRKLEAEFYKLVSVAKASRELKLCKEATRRLLSYWTLKRRANENIPLVQLTLEQQERLSGKQGVVFIAQQKTLEIERFLHLRQDLERLRNLCYMIVRREKMRKELHRTSMEIFYKQNDMLLDRNEDLSGDNLDFIRHRTAKFSQFSENYQTKRQYELLYGKRISVFDSSFDESDDDLLNSSQLEHLNLDELQRVMEKRVQKKKKQNPKNETENLKSEIHNELRNTRVKSEVERNIFDILTPKGVSLSQKGSRSPVTDICSTDNLTSNSIREHFSIQKKTSSPIREKSPSRLIGVFLEDCKVNLIDNNFENVFAGNAMQVNDLLAESDHKAENITAPISNDIPTSRLLKKGKKRFRNLHKFNREGCRNSPRLRSSNIEEKKDMVRKSGVFDPDKLSKIINEAKRRRLNSSGDYMTEYEKELPDFVRITRSRVMSCS